jgi:hypothetical protein
MQAYNWSKQYYEQGLSLAPAVLYWFETNCGINLHNYFHLFQESPDVGVEVVIGILTQMDWRRI